MAIKNCEKCFKEFSSILLVDNKKRNLKNRKYCLECSPFGKHNTKKIKENKTKNNGLLDGKICSRCKAHKNPDEFYRRRNNKELSVYCKRCTNDQTIERARGLKRQALEYKGGKCEICNYSKCVAALEFHHLDPKQKDFSISMVRHYIFDKIKPELDKCMLVCSNCHREIHFEQYNHIEPKNSKERVIKIDIPKVDKRLRENMISAPIRVTKIQWPSPEEMTKLIWEMSTVQLAKKLGVSDKAVEKFCKKHDIEKPPRGYWAKKEAGKIL